MDANNTSLIVAGGGIGGLAAGLALHNRGFQVKIYEAVSELRPLGVGINLLPHAVRALDELGALSAVLDVGLPCEDLAYFDADGRLIWSELRGVRAGYRWPQISIHRGHLQMALFELVRERLGADSICLGHQYVRAEQTDGGVKAVFRTSDGTEVDIEADLLIGADGIKSSVRAGFYPDEGEPRWNGLLMCRGTAVHRPLLSGRCYAAVADSQKLFLTYPIATADAARGTALINWVAQFRPGDSEVIPQEEWNREISPEQVLAVFGGWQFDWLNVPELVSAAEKIFVFPQIDRDPIDRWTFGRITLLGDAAHPMIPNGSNGASQAVLDAVALAKCLHLEPDIDRALTAYESLRRPQTGRIVSANRQFGLPRVLQIHQDAGGNASEAARTIAETMSAYQKLAGFDLETVNAGVNPASRDRSDNVQT